MNILDILKYKILLRNCYYIKFTPFCQFYDYTITKYNDTKTNTEIKYENQLWKEIRSNDSLI